MSILSVDKISPIGSGTTLTLNATETKVNNFLTVGTGASVSSPSSNVLTLGTNSTEKVRITANGDLGIGTINPSTNLHIVSDKNALIKLESTDANSGIMFVDSDTGAQPPVIYGIGDDFAIWTDYLERLRITSAGLVGVGLTNPQTVLHINNNVPMIRLTDANASGTPDCELGGAGGNIDISADINGEKSDSVIRFNVDGSTRATVDSTGDLTISDGDLIIGTAGHGIDFSASAGPTNGTTTLDSELLDDYEEGKITFESDTSGITIDTNYKGRYTKIGELVTVSGYIALSSFTSSNNQIRVKMPFTSAPNSEGYYTRGVGATFSRFMNFPSNYHNMVAYVGGGENYMRFFMTRNAGGSAEWHQMTHSNLTSNTGIYFNVCYTTLS